MMIYNLREYLLILTKHVNGCELNFGVFRGVWISEMLNVCFSLSFLMELVSVFVVASVVCMCSMSEVPRKGKIPQVYYYNIS